MSWRCLCAVTGISWTKLSSSCSRIRGWLEHVGQGGWGWARLGGPGLRGAGWLGWSCVGAVGVRGGPQHPRKSAEYNIMLATSQRNQGSCRAAADSSVANEYLSVRMGYKGQGAWWKKLRLVRGFLRPFYQHSKLDALLYCGLHLAGFGAFSRVRVGGMVKP